MRTVEVNGHEFPGMKIGSHHFGVEVARIELPPPMDFTACNRITVTDMFGFPETLDGVTLVSCVSSKHAGDVTATTTEATVVTAEKKIWTFKVKGDK